MDNESEFVYGFFVLREQLKPNLDFVERNDKQLEYYTGRKLMSALLLSKRSMLISVEHQFLTLLTNEINQTVNFIPKEGKWIDTEEISKSLTVDATT